jgi:hypothetical protein
MKDYSLMTYYITYVHVQHVNHPQSVAMIVQNCIISELSSLRDRLPRRLLFRLITEVPHTSYVTEILTGYLVPLFRRWYAVNKIRCFNKSLFSIHCKPHRKVSSPHTSGLSSLTFNSCAPHYCNSA